MELEAIYDSRNSFYGKAKVDQIGTNKYLTSYNTQVAQIIGKDAFVIKDNEGGLWSDTTLRHIKEFLKQNNFKAETKKQILEDYV